MYLVPLMMVAHQQLALSLLSSQNASEVLEKSVVLSTSDDPLCKCMALWSLSRMKLPMTTFNLTVEELDKVGAMERGPEALTNTARAVAQASLDSSFEKLRIAAEKHRERFSLGDFVTISRAFAVAGAVGPFGETAPRDLSSFVHATVGERLKKIDNFVSEEEREELLRNARWQPSRAHGEGRTSETATLESTPLVEEIQRRAAAVFGLSGSHCESLQLVKYKGNQHYVDHLDLLDDQEQLLVGGQRVGTVLVYLTDNTSGETVFPRLGIRVRPTRNTAIAWCNVDENGNPDLATRHAALPLSSSSEEDIFSSSQEVKIAINCWIRAFPDANLL